MSKLEVLIVSPDKHFYRNYLQSTLEPHRFISTHTETLIEAKRIIQEKKGLVGIVFLDITHSITDNPIETMHDLRIPYFPEVILCVKTSKDDDKTFALPIIDYLRGGASNVLRVPTYESEIVWVAKKAMTIYLTRKRVIDSLDHTEYTERMNQFFSLILSRKERGMPISYTELELFFLPKNKDITKETIIEKVKKPPINDYKNTTILIVEDEVKTSQWYKEYLDRNCFNVLIANSGKEALDKIHHEENVHIVLLDVELGDMTGSDLIPTIKTHHPKAEIIMITAFTEFDLIINTLKLGAFDFLVKSETDLAIINQKIIQALHKRYFEDFFQHVLE